MSAELKEHARRLYEETDQPVSHIALDCGVNESVVRRMAPREGWVRFVAPPRDMPPVARLLAEVEAMERATFSLPPRSGGEGRFGERQRNEAGWGEACAPLQTPANADASLPPNDIRCSASAFPLENTAAESRLCPSPPFASRTGGGERQDNAAAQNIARFIAVVMAHLDEFEAVRRNGKLLAKQHLATARAISILTEAFNRLQRLRAAATGSNAHELSDASDISADADAFRLDLARRIAAFMESRPDNADAGGAAAPAPGAAP
ncbi:MAG: hypothetical protein WAM62_09490 [Pseudolabrys sp.]